MWIYVQQSLFKLSNLTTDALNKITCRYEQLQLVAINEISFVGVIMLNVIDSKVKSIKHI